MNKNIIVLMGGESDEGDVSIRSGMAVVHALPQAGYIPIPVIIGRDGRWLFQSHHDDQHQWIDLPRAIEHIRDVCPLCVFIAMHGQYGEDGRIQALFDLLHIPYIGSDMFGSAVAMDKWLAKGIYQSNQIPTPQALLIRRSEFEDNSVGQIINTLGLPSVVKTPRSGSSIGVMIVETESGLMNAIREGLKKDERVICEKFISGREFTVPVLEDHVTHHPQALPVIEIVVKKKGFFDYEAKYDASLSEEICPADIPDELRIELQQLGVRAHKALLLSGFSRTDFMVDRMGQPWALETNTIPGLTEVSLFPKSAEVAGITFADLVDRLIKRAVS